MKHHDNTKNTRKTKPLSSSTSNKALSSKNIQHQRLDIGQKLIKLLYKNVNGFKLSADYKANLINEILTTTTTTTSSLSHITVNSKDTPHPNNNQTGIKKDLSLTYGEIVPSSFLQILNLIKLLSTKDGNSINKCINSNTNHDSLEFVDLGCGSGKAVITAALLTSSSSSSSSSSASYSSQSKLTHHNNATNHNNSNRHNGLYLSSNGSSNNNNSSSSNSSNNSNSIGSSTNSSSRSSCSSNNNNNNNSSNGSIHNSSSMFTKCWGIELIPDLVIAAEETYKNLLQAIDPDYYYINNSSSSNKFHNGDSNNCNNSSYSNSDKCSSNNSNNNNSSNNGNNNNGSSGYHNGRDSICMSGLNKLSVDANNNNSNSNVVQATAVEIFTTTIQSIQSAVTNTSPLAPRGYTQTHNRTLHHSSSLPSSSSSSSPPLKKRNVVLVALTRQELIASIINIIISTNDVITSATTSISDNCTIRGVDHEDRAYTTIRRSSDEIDSVSQHDVMNSGNNDDDSNVDNLSIFHTQATSIPTSKTSTSTTVITNITTATATTNTSITTATTTAITCITTTTTTSASAATPTVLSITVESLTNKLVSKHGHKVYKESLKQVGISKFTTFLSTIGMKNHDDDDDDDDDEVINSMAQNIIGGNHSTTTATSTTTTTSSTTNDNSTTATPTPASTARTAPSSSSAMITDNNNINNRYNSYKLNQNVDKTMLILTITPTTAITPTSISNTDLIGISDNFNNEFISDTTTSAGGPIHAYPNTSTSCTSSTTAATTTTTITDKADCVSTHVEPSSSSSFLPSPLLLQLLFPLSSLPDIQFTPGSIFDIPWWQTADVIYAASLLFTQEMMMQLTECVYKMKRGSWVITLKPLVIERENRKSSDQSKESDNSHDGIDCSHTNKSSSSSNNNGSSSINDNGSSNNGNSDSFIGSSSSMAIDNVNSSATNNHSILNSTCNDDDHDDDGGNSSSSGNCSVSNIYAAVIGIHNINSSNNADDNTTIIASKPIDTSVSKSLNTSSSSSSSIPSSSSSSSIPSSSSSSSIPSSSSSSSSIPSSSSSSSSIPSSSSSSSSSLVTSDEDKCSVVVLKHESFFKMSWQMAKVYIYQVQ